MNKISQDHKVMKYYCNMNEVYFHISRLQKQFKDEFKKNFDIDIICGMQATTENHKMPRYYIGAWFDSSNKKHLEQINWISQNVENS